MKGRKRHDHNDQEAKASEGPWNGLLFPVVLVLGVALLFFLGNKILFTDRSYRDLVVELQSKTFGNRWIAAYELSKIMANQAIPEEDLPWLIEKLEEIYDQSEEARTRNFIVIALGRLVHPRVASILTKAAVNDSGKEVVFHSLVGLGRMPEGSIKDWNSILKRIHKGEDDVGILQAGIYLLSHNKVPQGEQYILHTLKNTQNQLLRYAAAVSLTSYKNQDKSVTGTLREILGLPNQGNGKLTPLQVKNLKLNCLKALKKSPTYQSQLRVSLLENARGKDLELAARSKEILNQIE